MDECGSPCPHRCRGFLERCGYGWCKAPQIYHFLNIKSVAPIIPGAGNSKPDAVISKQARVIPINRAENRMLGKKNKLT